MTKHVYMAVDLKSFYASVECIERGFDPLDTLLVVADASRTEKTICLAISPSLKKYGLGGRARLFEVVSKVKEINAQRAKNAPYGFKGSSYYAHELEQDPSLKLDYFIAPPRMAFYLEYSTYIHEIYLKYFAPEDIHVYSIDEVMIDITPYLKNTSAKTLAKKVLKDIYMLTGLTATAGIGTNLYLCKVAMDIMAKHVAPDKDGMRIAVLNEERYRRYLWSHRPLTDFWRVGRGYAKRLEAIGLYTMGDIARCSLGKVTDRYNEDLLYQMFGVNAELLIDHAWGYEPCTMQDIKRYRPEKNSIGAGQVLNRPYSFSKARLVILEMVESLTLDLVSKGLVSSQMTLSVGYDKENLDHYQGALMEDRYGRSIPKHAHGTIRIDHPSNLFSIWSEAILAWYDIHVNHQLTIRRLNLSALDVKLETNMSENYQQLTLFSDLASQIEKEKKQHEEKKLMQATLAIKQKYGKNALLKGTDFEEGATARERNETIGGHKA